MLSKKDIDLLLVDITVHLDILGYSIVLPIMASLSQRLGGTVKHTSYLFSCYAVTQLISYLYMGRVSDRYGRKPMLILSLLGSSIGAIAQGLANSIWSLIIWRSITGLFAGSWIVAQAYIADCTTPDERPKYLARLEAFLAAAYIFGPAIGGFLGEIRLGLPFIVAGIVAGIALLFVIFFLSESLDKEAVKKRKEKKTKKTNYKKVFAPVILLCMAFEFCNRWIINGWDSYYNSYANARFGLTSLSFSILVTALGCLSCFLDGYLYPLLLFKFNVPIPYVSFFAGLFQLISQLTIAFSSSLVGATIGSILLEISYSMSTPAPSSIISAYSSGDIQGEILSYNMLCGQVAMIFSPLAMSSLGLMKDNLPWIISSLTGVIVMICMICVIRMPGGLSVGRVSADNLDKDMKQEVEMTDSTKNKPDDNLSTDDDDKLIVYSYQTSKINEFSNVSYSYHVLTSSWEQDLLTSLHSSLFSYEKQQRSNHYYSSIHLSFFY